MFVGKIKREGLAHLSWIIGSDGKAGVVDTRCECDVYAEIAARNGCLIFRRLDNNEK